jgi:hypothetical protein
MSRSDGKNSALALWMLRLEDREPAALITTIAEDGCAPVNSWKACLSWGVWGCRALIGRRARRRAEWRFFMPIVSMSRARRSLV